MWDDMSVYWKRDLVLKILGHLIPIVHWPEVYKRWKRGDWDVIKSNYVDWKAVVERYRRGTPTKFWGEFRDSEKNLSYMAIVARLTAESVKENEAIAQRARAEYGEAFNTVFSYPKGSSRIIMKDPMRIAIKYHHLHKQ